MKKLFLAIGHQQIHEVIKKLDEIEVCGEVFSRKELLSTLGKTRPDILIVSEFLKEVKDLDLVMFLLQVKEKMPNVRIVYLAGNMDVMNNKHRERLQKLINVGIYDICTTSNISPGLLKNFIYSESGIKNVSVWLDLKQEEKKETNQNLMYNTALNERLEEDQMRQLASEVMQSVQEGIEDDYVLNNVFVISSIKPGSGKSFLSSNLATAIAKYGKLGPNGKAPTVAIIEGDLQNLSVGTLLSLEDDKYNLKTAMEKIDGILDKRTLRFKSNVTQQEVDELDRFIKGCMKPYNKVKNLYALVGSQFKPDELKNVTAQHYIYLIETLADLFDIVIVDSNSSLTNVTTYPLLRLANRCLYVLNLDFNNVHNNHRYREKLMSLGIGHKVVYVLNEDITQVSGNLEPLSFGPDDLLNAGYVLSGRIPAIDKSVFLNRLYAGVPVILDDTPNTLKARLEISKIANTIWPMTNIEALELEVENRSKELTEKNKRRGLFGFKSKK